jgi:hypothetical protein
MIPPAVKRALCDPALRGPPVHVYLFVLGELSLRTEWQQIKVRSVRNGLRISTRATVRSLKLLVESGYLQRQRHPAARGGGYFYRMVWAGPSDVSPPASLRAS